MLSMYQQNRRCNQIIIWLVSGIIHLSLATLMLIASDWTPNDDEPLELVSEMLIAPPPLPDSPPQPEPEAPAPEPEPPQPEPEPPAPEPEPPKPEPPKPEPPKPEPPKPEPPKPEPPKPEPPKPEPPKPEPPKPEPPKPEPPKPEPPKPKPIEKPEPPKPPKPKPPTIAERLKAAKVHRDPVQQPPQQQPRRPAAPVQQVKAADKQELAKRMGQTSRLGPVASVQSTSRFSGRARVQQQQAQEEANYAEQVVKAAYYDAWRIPRLGNSHPTPVQVEMDVSPDGRATMIRITKRSNDARMNQSVEELTRTIRQFTPFAQVGISATSLHIVVIMEVED